MTFAQFTPPTGSDLMVWLGCCAFIMMLVNQAIKIKTGIFPSRNQTDIYPQPLSVRESHDYVTEKDCHNMHASTEAQIKELRAIRIDDIKLAAASREKMYGAIEKVRIELSASNETMKRDIAKGFQDVERAIGQLEGKTYRR